MLEILQDFATQPLLLGAIDIGAGTRVVVLDSGGQSAAVMNSFPREFSTSN